MKKIALIILVLIFCLMMTAAADTKQTVIVNSEQANIRSQPGLDSEVTQKPQINDQTDNPTKEVKPLLIQEKLFSGFYLKGGLMTSPEVDSIADKWLLALGFDSAIGEYLTWGLEFQPYYRSYTSNDGTYNISLKDISTNIFLNLKGGINIGKLIKSLKFLTIYAGGGIGTNLSYTMVDINGTKGNQFNPYLAWHFSFGTEIKLGKVSLIIEFQGNQIIVKDVDPATQSFTYTLVGIRF